MSFSLCFFYLDIMDDIVTRKICNVCSWCHVFCTILSYFQNLQIAFFAGKLWGREDAVDSEGVVRPQANIWVRRMFIMGAFPVFFSPMLNLLLSHSPELTGSPKSATPVLCCRPELKGYASSTGVPGSRHCVWTRRPAEWAGGCCPLHPQWHWWNRTGRSGGPGGHSCSPGSPCWAPGKISPLCPDQEPRGKRREHPIFHKNHFKAFVSISSSHLQCTCMIMVLSGFNATKSSFFKVQPSSPQIISLIMCHTSLWNLCHFPLAQISDPWVGLLAIQVPIPPKDHPSLTLITLLITYLMPQFAARG